MDSIHSRKSGACIWCGHVFVVEMANLIATRVANRMAKRVANHIGGKMQLINCCNLCL